MTYPDEYNTGKSKRSETTDSDTDSDSILGRFFGQNRSRIGVNFDRPDSEVDSELRFSAIQVQLNCLALSWQQGPAPHQHFGFLLQELWVQDKGKDKLRLEAGTDSRSNSVPILNKFLLWRRNTNSDRFWVLIDSAPILVPESMPESTSESVSESASCNRFDLP
ncbi:hypothetical protein B0H19DRAFT_1084491 [Mycena capillaripes]|nr:hypothetical protein B0H19DRAFT_1084491 [Mycena capillaripes]